MKKIDKRKGKQPILKLQILIIIISLLLVTIVILLGNKVFRETRKVATDQFNQQQLILARSAATSINVIFKEYATQLSSLAQLPTIQQMTPECLKYMQHTYSDFPPRTSIRRLDQNGILRFIHPFEGWRKELIGRDYNKKIFFQQSKNTGRIILSSLITNEQGQTRIRIAVPVYQTHKMVTIKAGKMAGAIFMPDQDNRLESKKFTGILVGSFDIYLIAQNIISPIISGKTGYAWLLNEKGVFIAYHEKEFVGRNAFKVRREKNPEIIYKTIDKIQRHMIAGKEGVGRYITGWHKGEKKKIEKLIAYTPAHLNNHIWSVAVCAPVYEVEEIIRSAHRSELYILSFVILVLIGGGIFSFLISYRWAHSLEREVIKQTKELKETSDYLQNLIEYANAPIIVWNPEKKISIFNKAFEKMSGRSAEEMVGQPLDTLFPEKYRSVSLKKIESASEGKYWETVEIPILRKDGETRIGLWNSANIYNQENQTLLATIAQGQDITERKRSEEKLLYRVELERLISTLSTNFINVMPDEIDQRINYALQKIGEFADIDRSYIFLFYDNLTRMNNTHEWCAEGIKTQIHINQGLLVSNFSWCEGRIKRFETIHVPRVADLPADVTEKEFFQSQGIQSFILVPMIYGKSLYGFLGFDSVGKEKSWSEDIIALLKIVGEMCVNVLERNQTEKALRESEENYRTLTENINLGIYRNSPDYKGTFLEANPAIIKIFGFKNRKEFLTINVVDLYQNPEDRNKFNHKMLREGFVKDEELKLKKKDGTLLIASVSTVAVKDEKGKIKYYDGIIEDITERKHLEQQFFQAQKMEGIGRLAGGIAHDFNNLLTSIIGYAEIAKMKLPSNSQTLNYTKQILKTADKATTLIQQLLAFSRRALIQPKVLDLNKVIRNFKPLLQRILGEDIILEFISDKTLGNIKIDPNQVEQIIMNLAVNSRDAMPKGGKLTIETRNVRLDKNYTKRYLNLKPGRYVLFAVSDTGYGMNSETLSHIFEPFFTTKEKGTGLGLSTVYGIVNQSGGHINVYSEVEKETIFKIYFPKVDEELEKEVTLSESSRLLKGKETVLLVEDEENILELTVKVLTECGYRVLTAKSGKTALPIWEKHKKEIDLLLTDVVMPGISGKELVEKLLPSKPELKVLYMSGYSRDIISYHGLVESDIHLIQKPFTPEELTRKIREVLT